MTAASELIHPFKRIIPMIYAYNTPGVSYHDGWTKIGYTAKQTVKDRIHQQTHTANIHPVLAWSDNAMYKDGSGEYFTDKDFHHYLEVYKKVKREPGTEWFQIDGKDSLLDFMEFASRRYEMPSSGAEYTLRKEQQEAVDMASAYFRDGGDEFLWNCKPRFGKTLSAYDLVRHMGFKHVLVVTNRPSIANSWAEDFTKFIGWRKPPMFFVSDSDALKGKEGVLTRKEYMDRCLRDDEDYGFISFESLQNMKGSVYLGGKYDKLDWITKYHFDLLIIDESQEGVDTKKTERAFKEIKRDHTLYLSGTPFKQLAEGRFSKSQIFNWSYADEQEAKDNWTSEAANPYERLPRLAMFTYQVSPMLTGKLKQDVDFSDEDKGNYAFDLNEFFATNEQGKFIHEEEIQKFLHTLYTGDKYPFSTEELRKEMAHTMWYLNRVPSAKALAKLLHEDPVFKDYEVVIAAGDGKTEETEESNTKLAKAYDRVKEAIRTHDKTITLTVGQLTVGVTIPEWSGVLMLCNMKSPSSYMQAAFRAQNPCTFTDETGKRYEKETAYVFDFDPARTLIIYDEFANNLLSDTVNGQGTTEDRKKNIKRLLNFFPVLGEDSEGRMVALDAAKVLSIPRKLKCEEVVRRGFMSNFLFVNISNVFGAPKAIQDIINRLEPAQEESGTKKTDLPEQPDMPLDDEGNVDIPDQVVIGKSTDVFGPKIYDDMTEDVDKPMADIVNTKPETPQEEVHQKLDDFKETISTTLTNHLLDPLANEYGMNKAQQNRMKKNIKHDVENTISTIQDDYTRKANIAKAEYERHKQEAQNEKELQQADETYGDAMKSALEDLTKDIQKTTATIIQNKPKELVDRMETEKKEKEKKDYEDKIRDHLRGFSRTIPSFLMAYGDKNLTLANLDDYTEDDVFKEVTGITEEDFRLLRDGGEMVDPETGEKVPFKGHLFDEVTFNDSVQEFLHKKETLANYFDEEQTEDIFNYIPPQKTNQIFTPRWVVEKMVDDLEKENPGCFDDPNATFADLYMKSGLYITEIVKRLYRSKKMKAFFPDKKNRIRHILEKQVYGMAPTRIIYLIATNYIMGFDEHFKNNNPHFVEEDAAEDAKQGILQERVDAQFGK